jgi:hypothetical protein
LIAGAEGAPYEAFRSLEAARAFDGAVAVLEGDYGGQIYLTCPVTAVHCDEQSLRQLLADIDQHQWDDPEGMLLVYERLTHGSSVSTGVGGGRLESDAWLHPELLELGLEKEMREVLSGKRRRIRRASS